MITSFNLKVLDSEIYRQMTKNKLAIYTKCIKKVLKLKLYLLQMNNKQNINFLQNSSLRTQHTNSSKFPISQSISGTLFFEIL